MPPTGPSPRYYATQRRDRAISRVRRTTRWVAALAVLGTAVVVEVAAHEVPAKSTSASSVGTSTSSGSGSPSASNGSQGSGVTPSPATNAGGGALSPPSAPPTQSTQAPSASTGAS